MNLNDLKTFILEVLENPGSVKDVNQVMEKAFAMYQELSEMFAQANPEERERIAESLMELGTFFDQKIGQVASDMGMSKEDLLIAMQDPNNYTEDVWGKVQNFQNKVEVEKNQLVKKLTGNEETSKPKTKVKKFNSKKAWVSA